MVSGSVKPHRGLVFFCSKNEIPAGVSDIQGVGKCKPHPVVYYLRYPESLKPTLYLPISATLNALFSKILAVLSLWTLQKPIGD